MRPVITPPPAGKLLAGAIGYGRGVVRPNYAFFPPEGVLKSRLPFYESTDVRFLDETRGIGGEVLAFETHERERIVDVIDRGFDQRIDTLAHQAGIGAIDQHDRHARIGFGDEAIDVGGFDGGHGSLVPDLRCTVSRCIASGTGYVPATKYDARRLRMFSEIDLAARFSASRRPRSPAKRCCWPGML